MNFGSIRYPTFTRLPLVPASASFPWPRSCATSSCSTSAAHTTPSTRGRNTRYVYGHSSSPTLQSNPFCLFVHASVQKTLALLSTAFDIENRVATATATAKHSCCILQMHMQMQRQLQTQMHMTSCYQIFAHSLLCCVCVCVCVISLCHQPTNHRPYR